MSPSLYCIGFGLVWAGVYNPPLPRLALLQVAPDQAGGGSGRGGGGGGDSDNNFFGNACATANGGGGGGADKGGGGKGFQMLTGAGRSAKSREDLAG